MRNRKLRTSSSGDTITSIAEAHRIREDEVRAYERRTGFVGIGEYLESLGKIMIIREKKC